MSYFEHDSLSLVLRYSFGGRIFKAPCYSLCKPMYKLQSYTFARPKLCRQIYSLLEKVSKTYVPPGWYSQIKKQGVLGAVFFLLLGEVSKGFDFVDGSILYERA